MPGNYILFFEVDSPNDVPLFSIQLYGKNSSGTTVGGATSIGSRK